MNLLEKFGIAFAVWAIITIVFNPWFEDKTLVKISYLLGALATLCFIFS